VDHLVVIEDYWMRRDLETPVRAGGALAPSAEGIRAAPKFKPFGGQARQASPLTPRVCARY